MVIKQQKTNLIKTILNMNNKYYDGSEKKSEQKPKATKKSTWRKIIKGAGSLLGVASVAVTGIGLYGKIKK